MISANDIGFVRAQYGSSANLDVRIALHRLYSTASQPFHEWLFDHFAFPANARLLEIGCGSGALWQQNYSRIPSGWHPTLTDFLPGMVSTARTNLESFIFNLSSTQCDAQALPFRSATFDGVIANHMLYHVPDLPRTLGEIQRVLKRGGRLYAATNGENHFGETRALMRAHGVTTFLYERPFSLNNGAATLARYFASVRRFDFDDSLEVTEVEPLIAYLMSTNEGARQVLCGEMGNVFRQIVADGIAQRGAYHITKETGLFEAINL